MGKFARKTVTVPPELAARMDERKNQNWSAVATTAFAAELDRLAFLEELKLTDTFQRFAELEKEMDQDRRDAGQEAGRRWASQIDTKEELSALRNLSDFAESLDNSFGGREDAYGNSRQLYFAMFPDDGKDRVSAEMFWGTVTSDYSDREESYPGEGFLRGFIDGALEVWNEYQASK